MDCIIDLIVCFIYMYKLGFLHDEYLIRNKTTKNVSKYKIIKLKKIYTYDRNLLIATSCYFIKLCLYFCDVIKTKFSINICRCLFVNIYLTNFAFSSILSS